MRNKRLRRRDIAIVIFDASRPVLSKNTKERRKPRFYFSTNYSFLDGLSPSTYKPSGYQNSIVSRHLRYSVRVAG